MANDSGANQFAAVERLRRAAADGKPCPPVRGLLPDASVDAAYEVQQALTAEAVAAGRRIVGRKIGLTSEGVQAQLGVDQPDFGTLFADMAFVDGETIPSGRLLQPRVEVEVAFVLSTDISWADATPQDVMRATDFVVAAVEVVDSRIDGWDITILDTVADNASAGLFVTGGRPVALSALDLTRVRMELWDGSGAVVSTGRGRDCLGHPVAAVTWLARTMAARGEPMRAGDVVLSGALGPMVPAPPGSLFHAEIEGLGSLQCSFSDDKAEGRK